MPAPKNPAKRVKIEPGFGGKTFKIIGLRTGGQWRFVLQLIIPDFYAVRNEIIAIQSEAVTTDDLELPQNRGNWHLTLSSPHAVDNPGITVGLVRSSSTTGTFSANIEGLVSFGNTHSGSRSPKDHKSSAAASATINWQHTVSFSDLFTAEFLSHLPSYPLSIHVAVILTTNTVPVVVNHRNLVQAFRVIFGQPSPAQTPDMTLGSVARKKYPAHRVILASRSPIFAEKLVKSQAKTLEIKDIPDHALADLLQFLYTDTIALENQAVFVFEDLLKAAVVYGVSGMKEWIADFLLTDIDCRNVTALLDLADTYRLINLKTTCLEFVKFTVSLTNGLAYLSLAKELGDSGLEAQCVELVKERINVDNMRNYWDDDHGEPLRSFYLDFMQANITVKNVGYILMTAEEAAAPALKAAAMAFLLRDGHAQEFSVSAEFNNFRRDCSFALLNDLMTDVYNGS